MLTLPHAAFAASDDKFDANGVPALSVAQVLPQHGDPSGTRKQLSDRGIHFQFLYITDALANLRGGAKRGGINQGLLQTEEFIDFEKLAGWHGLTFYANQFFIHDSGRIRRDYVGGVNTIAAIEAVPTVRLSELWFEQSFANGAASVRAGQLAADVEFFYSSLSYLFLQSDFPTIAALNLPSGGPAYPLSTPGMRLKVEPHHDMTFLLALFNGDPAGPGEPGAEQRRNNYGVNFRTSDPALLFAEAQFRFNHDKDSTALASQIKLGGWSHFGSFADQRFASNGMLLADPAVNAGAAQHSANGGVYAVFEQQLFRPRGADADKGVSFYSRVSASPSDRNPVDFYADGGIVFDGMVAGRPNDRFGAGVIHAKFSDRLRQFDSDRLAFTGAPMLARDAETNLELTYQARLTPGWTVQPDFQYIWHPSQDVRKPNAMVIGARSILRF